jgi:hypothetical protein
MCEADACFGSRESWRPNTGFQLTPLCGRKIVAILTGGISPSAFPIYQCGAAEA